MVHAIEILKCNKGHYLPISFDSNECGCHHDGKPTLIITCSECLKETFKKFKTIKEALDDDEYAYRYGCGHLIAKQAIDD